MKRLLSAVFCFILALGLLMPLSAVEAKAASGVVTSVDGLVLDDPAEYSSTTKYIDASVTKIIKFLKLDGMPDWLKVLRIHDFICEFVEYDWEDDEQTLYKTLTVGKTRCSGYATFAKRLLQEMGINCRYISCPGINHAWNAVQLDGKWYNMDVTWDDPDDYDKINYQNFLRSDANFGHGRGGFDEDEYSGYEGITISERDFLCGSYGKDLYWVISDDNTLSFYGSGKTISNYCTGMEFVEHAIIPKGITTIGKEYGESLIAFGGCDKLADITIPTSVTYIGKNSFAYCYALTDVYYAGSEAQWNRIQVLEGNDDLLNARIHFAIPDENWQSPSGICGDNLTWTITGDRVLRIRGTGKMYDYEAGQSPWQAYADYIYDVDIGSGATSIGSYAFDNCRRLVGITVPNSVVSIGEYALNNCVAMNSFAFPKSVSVVGEGAFYGCKKLRVVKLTGNITHLADRTFYGCERLWRVAFPEGIVSIGDYCFYECTNFSTEGLPKSLTSIGAYAFAYCTVMDKIVTSPNITRIEAGTFYGCNGIKQLEIPSYISYIGEYAFSNCDWMQTLAFPGTDIIVEKYAFSSCGYLQDISLTGVTTIGQGVFSGCYNLEEIEIPSTVTSLGDEAFAKCSSLVSVTIPGSIKTMGQYIFKECTDLRTVIFAEGVTFVADNMFSYCISLREVDFPDSLTAIGDSAFDSCRNLEEINLPENLKQLGVASFYGCALKSITIPGSVRDMGINAFGACHELKTVTLEEGITAVGDSAFNNCYSLSQVEMPTSLTRIERSAFGYCSALKHISIPCGVTFVDNYAFRGCGLTDVYYGGTSNLWRQIQVGSQNTPLTNATIHFAEVMQGREGVCNDALTVWWCLTAEGQLVIYGNGAVETCGWNSYQNEITSVSILSGVTSIGGQVLRGLSKLERVQIADTVTSIDSFGNCASLTSIELPDSVTELGTFTFMGCGKLTSVTLPSGLTAIPEGAFAACAELESVTLSDSIVSIGNNAFSDCPKLKNMQLPESVTNIGEFAFYNCSSLKEINIPSGVTAINDCTFYGCSSLTSLILPEGITTIGQWVFWECGLTDIDLPKTLIRIGEDSFPMGALSNVYYAGNETDWEQVNIALGNNSLFFANIRYNWVRHTEAIRKENYTAATCAVDGGYDIVVYCSDCGEVLRREHTTLPAVGHSYQAATCTTPKTCAVCGATKDAALGHNYKAATCSNPRTCSRCKATEGKPLGHDYKEATCTKAKTCEVCHATSGKSLGHSYKAIVITKATATKDGKKGHQCTRCDYIASKTSTIYKASSVKLSATSYTYDGKVKSPSVKVKDSKGNTISSSHYTVTYASGRKIVGTYKVTVKFKGNYSGTKTLSFKINPISISKCSVKLSATSYTYNGSTKTPSVTVKNANGTKLTKGTHYTVTYSSGRKNVGTYKVTIKMKGNYSGTKTLTFKIIPRAASINKLTAKSKALSVKLNKQTTQTSGYQIQYATTKTFKSYKTATITSNKTTTKTLSGLKAKTTYYVRVRAYKTVSGVKIYSNWSAAKSMKTK